MADTPKPRTDQPPVPPVPPPDKQPGSDAAKAADGAAAQRSDQSASATGKAAAPSASDRYIASLGKSVGDALAYAKTAVSSAATDVGAKAKDVVASVEKSVQPNGAAFEAADRFVNPSKAEHPAQAAVMDNLSKRGEGVVGAVKAVVGSVENKADIIYYATHRDEVGADAKLKAAIGKEVQAPAKAVEGAVVGVVDTAKRVGNAGGDIAYYGTHLDEPGAEAKIASAATDIVMDVPQLVLAVDGVAGLAEGTAGVLARGSAGEAGAASAAERAVANPKVVPPDAVVIKELTKEEAAANAGVKATGGGPDGVVTPDDSRWGGPAVNPERVSSVAIRESKGASPLGTDFQAASAATNPALKTGIRATIGEAEAYKQTLARGEIGLERPQGVNVGGRADFITARVGPDGQVTVFVNDAKTVSSDASRFPKESQTMPKAWDAQVKASVEKGRLDLGDPNLENKIRDAVESGRVELRQINVDYRTQVNTVTDSGTVVDRGGGTISGRGVTDGPTTPDSVRLPGTLPRPPE